MAVLWQDGFQKILYLASWRKREQIFSVAARGYNPASAGETAPRLTLAPARLLFLSHPRSLFVGEAMPHVGWVGTSQDRGGQAFLTVCHRPSTFSPSPPRPSCIRLLSYVRPLSFPGGV